MTMFLGCCWDAPGRSMDVSRMRQGWFWVFHLVVNLHYFWLGTLLCIGSRGSECIYGILWKQLM